MVHSLRSESGENVVVDKQVEVISVDDPHRCAESGWSERCSGERETAGRRHVDDDRTEIRAEQDVVVAAVDDLPEVGALERIRGLREADVGASVVEVCGIEDGRLLEEAQWIVVA